MPIYYDRQVYLIIYIYIYVRYLYYVFDGVAKIFDGVKGGGVDEI